MKTLTGHALFILGISYHATGTLTHKGTRKVHSRWFKVDGVSVEQRDALKAEFNGIEFKGASPAFAPEIRSTLICQLTKAEIMRQAIAKAEGKA